MRRYFFILLLFVVVFSVNGQEVTKTQNKQTITISLNVAPTIRPAFLPLFKKFEDETGIRVLTKGYIPDDDFERYMHMWLIEGKGTPDVLYGHNGQRFLQMVESGAVHAIDDIWAEQDFDKQFRRELIDGLTFNGNRFAVPYSVYTWGIFYRKSVLKPFGPVPTTWDDFISYCHQLKKAGVAPFPASMKQPYIASAWFEYLMLRVHGLALFEELMSGGLSFQDKRVQLVLTRWQEMLVSDLFTTDYYDLRWEEYLPYFLRGKIAFVLMGTPLASRIYGNSLKEDVEFMAFPKINDIPKYETAPANIFFIAQNSEKKKLAEQFVRFISQASTQQYLSNHLHVSPANLSTNNIKKKYSLQGIKILTDAKGLSPFFDRGTSPMFEKRATVSFAMFLKHQNTEQLTNELEAARKESF